MIDGSARKQEDDEEERDGGDTVSSDSGLEIYKNSCIACHGDQGANGHNGPNLQDSKFAENRENVIERITNGGAAMPAFKDTLSEEEIQQVADYVLTVISPLGK